MALEKTVEINLPVLYNSEFAESQVFHAHDKEITEKIIEMRNELDFGSNLSLTEVTELIEQDESFEPVFCEKCHDKIGYTVFYEEDPESNADAFKIPVTGNTDREKPAWNLCEHCVKEMFFNVQT